MQPTLHIGPERNAGSVAGIGTRSYMKRGILLTFAGLLLSAWGLVVWSAMHMAAPVVTLMMPMQSAWTLSEVAAVWMMWAVMMGAMMLPSAVPVVVIHSRVSSARGGEPGAESRWFMAAYLVMWSFFSVAAAGLQWLLQFTGALSRMLVITQGWLACALLIGAGLYQLTPAKFACLQRCRTPIGFFATEWRQGRFGAFRMGVRYGSYCVGCCWALMAVLFVFGAMNLAAILVLTAGIAAEKLLPQGARTGQALGVMLIAWGLLLPFLR